MSLQILIAHSGERLECANPVPNSLDALRSSIYNATRIPPGDQVLLTGRGRPVKAQTLLSEVRRPTVAAFISHEYGTNISSPDFRTRSTSTIEPSSSPRLPETRSPRFRFPSSKIPQSPPISATRTVSKHGSRCSRSGEIGRRRYGQRPRRAALLPKNTSGKELLSTKQPESPRLISKIGSRRWKESTTRRRHSSTTL
jgi:hypothetical protein